MEFSNNVALIPSFSCVFVLRRMCEPCFRSVFDKLHEVVINSALGFAETLAGDYVTHVGFGLSEMFCNIGYCRLGLDVLGNNFCHECNFFLGAFVVQQLVFQVIQNLNQKIPQHFQIELFLLVVYNSFRSYISSDELQTSEFSSSTNSSELES